MTSFNQIKFKFWFKKKYDYRPSYVLSGPRGWPEIDNGDEPVPSVVSKRFARLPCFELLCTNILIYVNYKYMWIIKIGKIIRIYWLIRYGHQRSIYGHLGSNNNLQLKKIGKYIPIFLMIFHYCFSYFYVRAMASSSYMR